MRNPQNKTKEYNKTEKDSKIIISGYQWSYSFISDISNLCVLSFFSVSLRYRLIDFIDLLVLLIFLYWFPVCSFIDFCSQFYHFLFPTYFGFNLLFFLWFPSRKLRLLTPALSSFLACGQSCQFPSKHCFRCIAHAKLCFHFRFARYILNFPWEVLRDPCVTWTWGV